MSDNADPQQAAKLEAQRQRAEVSRMEKQFKATTRELQIRLEYLDHLAHEHETELTRLKSSPPSVLRDNRIGRIEKKLGFYHAVKQAADSASQANRSRTAPLTEAKPGTANLHRPKVQDVLDVKLAEAHAILAGARILIDDMTARMKVVHGLLGHASPLGPQDLALVQRVKGRAKTSPALAQRLQMIYQQFLDATAALELAEKQFETCKTMQGREALQFLLHTIKVPQLSGKLYHLDRLHLEYAGDPDLSTLFPPPMEIDYPAPPPESAEIPKTKAKGGLLGLFGLHKN
ncbi:MAG: hypothetical protein KGR26_02460 [Cyanobacteria bacterium REEB65]|nr:hypothetical protein [Cyanobacteria bacterium REEB65]